MKKLAVVIDSDNRWSSKQGIGLVLGGKQHDGAGVEIRVRQQKTLGGSIRAGAELLTCFAKWHALSGEFKIS